MERTNGFITFCEKGGFFWATITFVDEVPLTKTYSMRGTPYLQPISAANGKTIITLCCALSGAEASYITPPVFVENADAARLRTERPVTVDCIIMYPTGMTCERYLDGGWRTIAD